MSSNRLIVCGMLAMLALSCACAQRRLPPVAVTPAHPDFLYPVVPVAMKGTFAAEHVDLGWRYLQINDLRGADREFASALKSNAKMYPAHAGIGYVALARKDFDRALSAFDLALTSARTYVPALVGRGQALLALRRERDALESFDAALAVDSSLSDVRRRADLLRFRNLQDVIEAARMAAQANRVSEARAAYAKALVASPGSAFLYRELGLLERRAGNQDDALTNFRRAVELDPLDDLALVQIGEVLEARQDVAGAETAYRRALDLNPSRELEARLAAVVKAGREARLPPEFKAALTTAQLTRGELAALIGVRLEGLLQRAPTRQVVSTDTRDHWAAPWIAQVAAAGIMDPFENHTFQPGAAIRRGDLATALSRILTLLSESDPSLTARLRERPSIADMNQRHIQYPAAAAVVSAGILPLVDGNRFQAGRVVSGPEAVEALERVRALSSQTVNAGL